MKDYRSVADAVAEQIRAGVLKAGDRLPTQRGFARQHGIANSTATRVYRELARRGLATGEVGRGTFVRAASGAPGPFLPQPPDSWIDLELNYPVVPEQAGLLSTGLQELLNSGVLGSALRPVGPVGTPAARETAADLLARGGWRPDPARVLFAGSGRQAILGAVATLTRPGARLGVEELTFPALKAIATRLGVTLVPLAMDEEGLIPEAVEEAHRAGPLHALYVQPTLHNPLSLTLSDKRRDRLADLMLRLGIPAIEDAVWAFLRDDLPPLAARAPSRTVVIDSLSKRLSPGLSLGFAVAPADVAGALAGSLRSGSWVPMRFPLEAMSRWQTDGTVRALVRAKQREATVRQEISRSHLGGFVTWSHPRSYYLWWELPRPWRADTFVAAAARHGIGVAPAAEFSVGRRRAFNAIRLGLASLDSGALSSALATLAYLARSEPDGLATD